jgi:hypothetical protein
MSYIEHEELFDYHDDPIDLRPKLKKKKSSTGLAFILFLVGGGIFVQSTLASNISLNSGGAVEFGQGIAIAAACSGADVLTVTPNSEFRNTSGGGDHYLKTITVSGIPSGCIGADFNISTFDSVTSTALPMFNTNKTVATIYDNAGTFQIGTGGAGATITSGSGTFTITFTTPVALAKNISRLTLQSSGHVALNCLLDGVCSVGDNGPGGGTVYFVSASPFSSPGSICDTNCRYLEVAKSTWLTGSAQNDGESFYLSSTNDPLPAQDFLTTFGAQVGTYRGTAEKNNWFIGQGFRNTQLIAALTGNTSSNSVAVKARSFAPIGYSSTVGQWFIPSFNELNELCKYANGQTTGVTSRQCMGNTPYNTAGTNTTEGFRGSNNYFSSSITSTGAASLIYFGNGESNWGAGLKNDSRGARPVRAF